MSFFYFSPSHVFTKFIFFSFPRYHIPRSILRDGDNILVLFEEFGGSPLNVKFQTVTPLTICGNTYEGHKLELSCQGGRVISDIRFLSFGNPKGVCGAYEKGVCEAASALSVIEKVNLQDPPFIGTQKFG